MLLFIISLTTNILLKHVHIIHQAENLEKPWGDCGKKPLKYFDDYSFSNCRVECETDDLVNHCHCRDGFMPGNSTGYNYMLYSVLPSIYNNLSYVSRCTYNITVYIVEFLNILLDEPPFCDVDKYFDCAVKQMSKFKL